MQTLSNITIQGFGFCLSPSESELEPSGMATAVSTTTTFLPRITVETVRTGSLLEKLEDLRRAGKDELPSEFTVDAPLGSTIRHDEWNLELPVINLALLETDRAEILRQMHKAASEWGLFQIVNHGIPSEVLHNAQAQGLNFFDLPLEDKQKAGHYIGDNTKTDNTNLYWAESLAFRLDTWRGVGQGANDKILDAVAKFGSALDRVNTQLLEILAECLGLPTEIFAEHVDGKKALFRWILYPACPKPRDIIGNAQHTDPFVLTLLLQDQVGGLQIEKDGEWVGVKPIEGALTVNIGDTLHVWTNGIYKNAMHRVVVNEEISRLSIIAFYAVAPQLTISAPEELVDDSHPRRYKPFVPSYSRVRPPLEKY